MAIDPGLAQTLRDDLADMVIVEKKMFGGLAFLLNGHMVCGLHKGGAMFRVGAGQMAAGLAVPGVRRMMMATRPMAGMIDCPAEVVADDTRRGVLMALALSAVRNLPPKVAKPRKG